LLGLVLRSTLPVAFGYLPLGFAFGVLLSELGVPWWYAFLMSLLIYAGAAQFMVLGLLRSQASLLDFFVMTLALNIRHVFYGMSFLHRYRPLKLKNLYLIGSLTDETYSLLTTVEAPASDRRRFDLLVSSLNHLYWVTGCTTGALAGHVFRFKAPELEFALPCLFIVLAIEQVRAKRRLDLVGASAAAAAAGLVAGGNATLIVAIGLAILVLVVTGSRSRWQI
jgi:4-azaleucine resistance transporter AzlC